MLNADGTNVWPENYEFHYSGLKNMRFAVEQSINGMAVRTLQAVTPEKAVAFGQKLGLPLLDQKDGPNNDEHLAPTLGGLTEGVTPLEMTSAFGVLGSLGMKTDPVVITKIENKSGEVIWEAKPNKERVVSQDSTWLMVDIMKGSITRGTSSYEAKGWHNWPAAGKTGTTEEWHDAWFIGFTSEIVTGVWTGYDNLEERKRLPYGGGGWKNWTGAGPPTRIWTAIMDQIYKQAPPDWEQPKGVVKASVCSTTGMLPSPLCPADKITEDWFRADYVPKKVDDILTQVKVVQQPWTNPKDIKATNRYYLWQPGCAGTPETLTLLKKHTTWVKHPTDPNNVARYWPADWWLEVPTEKCTPGGVQPPKPTSPGTGTGTGTGTGSGTGTGTGNGSGNGTGNGNGSGAGSGSVTQPPVLPPSGSH
jgi:penicillin-binding protein 1A